ncbi:MAG: hypothetical protein HYV35_03005 [Lentisphaerae bacterium]|nr:hypothetical protein [Lentisphaerota bacterium]
MKKRLKTWLIDPLAFMAVYLLASLVGSALYTVAWQFTFDRGRPPNELGGWFLGSCLAAAVAMLNLCGLNQLLFLPACLWPRLRQTVGFRFAILSGMLFGALPLTVKEILRQSSGHRISIMNGTTADYALSWTTCGVLFVALAWLCALWKAGKQTNRTIAFTLRFCRSSKNEGDTPDVGAIGEKDIDE